MKKLPKKCVVLVALIVFLLVGCRQLTVTPKAEWNFLVYMAADNNLERFAIQDINEMERVGSSGKLNVLVLVDRIPGYDTSNGNWTTTRLYKITHDAQNSSEIVSELLVDYGELDMSNPDTLANFVAYCNDKYPADNTMFTLWNHGTGVYPRGAGVGERYTDEFHQSSVPVASRPVPVASRGIGQDYTTGVSMWDMLLTDEIATALVAVTQEKKIDLINMDACLMQMFEVGWELTNVAHFVTGSQALTPGVGNNYTKLLQYLTAHPSATREELATYVVDCFYQQHHDWVLPTNYAALSLDTLSQEVMPAFRQVVNQLMALSQSQIEQIRTIRHQLVTQPDETYTEYVDMVDFFTELKESGHFTTLEPELSALLAALDRAVVHHKGVGLFGEQEASSTTLTHTPLHGVSITLPYTQEGFAYYSSAQGYPLLRIAKESKWFEFLELLNR